MGGGPLTTYDLQRPKSLHTHTLQLPRRAKNNIYAGCYRKGTVLSKRGREGKGAFRHS